MTFSDSFDDVFAPVYIDGILSSFVSALVIPC